jgi:protein phosphatase
MGGRPGSTVVAILVHDGGTEVAHVGDSRCYQVHAGQIFQLTRDHSAVQKLVDAQMLTPAQAAAHPDANKITRALGMAPGVEVELRPQPVAHVAGDVFVLCSDGLSDLVEPPDILRIAGSSPPPQAAGQLVELANARGGHDNITVAIVRVRESVVGPRGDGPGPTVTQTMPQKTMLQAPAAIAPPLAASSGPSLTAGADDRPSAPPSRMAGGRPVSPAVVVALILGGLGVCAIAVALYGEVSEHHRHTVAPFALTPPEAGSLVPSATVAPLAPVAPVPLVVPTAEDASPSPLPSLVPSRPRH